MYRLPSLVLHCLLLCRDPERWVLYWVHQMGRTVTVLYIHPYYFDRHSISAVRRPDQLPTWSMYFHQDDMSEGVVPGLQ